MRMGKRGLTVPQFLIGMLIFSVVLVTGVGMINNLNDNYAEVNMSTDKFADTYDTIDEMYNFSREQEGKVLDAEISDSESWESMTKGSYSGIRMVKNTFKLFGDVINNIVGELSIPGYFVIFLFAGFLIWIVWKIIAMIFRFKDT